MDLRDELAARIAVALAETESDDAAIARRAYELADALLDERAATPEDEIDPRWLDPPYEPAWELDPRWSRADEARRAARAAALHSPGIASVRPTDPALRKSG